jgi:hypothetical protein
MFGTHFHSVEQSMEKKLSNKIVFVIPPVLNMAGGHERGCMKK